MGVSAAPARQTAMTRMNILWFGVNAGLVPALALEAALADGLAQSGDLVTRISCHGVLDAFCPVMQSEGLTAQSPQRDKHRICRKCRSLGASADDKAGYRTVHLDDYITDAELSGVDDVLAGISRENWNTLVREGIDVGRYSTYLSMLNHKVEKIAAHDQAWFDYVADLRNSLIAACALPRIFDEVHPTHALVYNPLYPTNRVFWELALQRGVKGISISTGGFVPNRAGTLAIYPHLSASQTLVDSQTVVESLRTPCTADEVQATERHLRGLVVGHDPWVYSSAPTGSQEDEIREKVGVAPGRRVVLALVASPDETRSSELVDAEFVRVPGHDLSDVQEFVRTSVDFGERNPDLDVVIRLHPRLSPNKRERITSPDLEPIQRILKSRPSNVHVNAPGDGVGLYDVMRIADVGLNQSSSSGLELLVHGIPVVHYDPPRMNAYPTHLGLEVDRGDSVALDAGIRQALTGRVPPTFPRDAFRWYAVTLLRVLVHRQGLASETVHQLSTTTARVPPVQHLRSIVPTRIRYRVARWLSHRQELRQVKVPQTKEAWVEEARERILGLGSGPIWNPQTLVRGIPLEDDQAAIGRVMSSIHRDLGWPTRQ